MLYGVGDIIIGDKAVCTGSVSFTSQTKFYQSVSFNDFGNKILSGGQINQKSYFMMFELGADAWIDFQTAFGMTETISNVSHRESKTFQVGISQEYNIGPTSELKLFNETTGKKFTAFIESNGILSFTPESVGHVFTAYYDKELTVTQLIGLDEQYVKLSAKLYSAANSVGYYLVANKAIRQKVSPLSFGENGLYNVTFQLVAGKVGRQPFQLYELLPPELVEPSELIGLETEAGVVLQTQAGVIIEAQIESFPLQTQNGQDLETQDGQIIRI